MNYLDLGVFLPNAKGGAIMSDSSPPQYMPNFELNQLNALQAEKYGFEFILSMVKWRGFGGKTNHWDYSLESFTLMAALASITHRIKLYASVAVTTIHPAVIAKMAMTIDDISKGRFGVNLVSGWNKLEYSQMGLWRGDDYFSYRYDYATEYVQVLKLLWETGRASFKGKFFELEDCKSLPHPLHQLPIICAGQSERGMRFTAQWGNYNFIGGQDDKIDELGILSRRLKKIAAEYGRKVGAYVLLTVVMAETDEEAQAMRQSYIDNGDVEAQTEWARVAGMDFSRATYRDLSIKTFMAIPAVTGSYATVAKFLDRLAAEMGIDGVCLIFPDYNKDLSIFCERVVPLMKSRDPNLLQAA